MARCEGTTQSGEQCKLDAQEDSRFCHLHGEKEAEADQESAAAEEALCWDDVAHLVLAGVVVAGMFLFIRSFGKWIPRL